MRIPKSKMPAIMRAIGFVLDEHPEPDEFFNEEELELIRQMHDRASLCQHGDATALDIEVFYGSH